MLIQTRGGSFRTNSRCEIEARLTFGVNAHTDARRMEEEEEEEEIQRRWSACSQYPPCLAGQGLEDGKARPRNVVEAGEAGVGVAAAVQAHLRHEGLGFRV